MYLPLLLASVAGERVVFLACGAQAGSYDGSDGDDGLW